MTGACGHSDGGDLVGLCAVAAGRDLGAILDDQLEDGTPNSVSVPGGAFNADELEDLTRSFADIVEQDTPSEMRTDAGTYATGLRSALDGDPVSEQQRADAIAAGARLAGFLADECPENGRPPPTESSR